LALTRSIVPASLQRQSKANLSESVFTCTENPPFRNPPTFPMRLQDYLNRSELDSLT
jgi:hypothetical protein